MKSLFQFHIKALSSLARLRLLNIRNVCLRRLNPRRLAIIFDLETELVIVLATIMISSTVFAECVEYKIIDHGDSVEAVCVGVPLTPEEQRQLDQERRNNDALQERLRKADEMKELNAKKAFEAEEKKKAEAAAKEIARKPEEKNKNMLDLNKKIIPLNR
jgi:hypothetical protein